MKARSLVCPHCGKVYARPNARMNPKPTKKKNPGAPCRPQYGRRVVDRVFELARMGWGGSEIERQLQKEWPGLGLTETTIALWVKYGVTKVRARGKEENIR